MTIVFLNGDFLPLDQAKVSVMDRGFLFADSVYEVIPVHQGRIFCCDQHLERLQTSLDAIRLPLVIDKPYWHTLLAELMARNGGTQSDQSIYLQITRGPQPTRSHVSQGTVKPTIFAQCTPLHTPTLSQLRQGATAITYADIRWKYCYIKSTALIANVLLAELAKEVGAHETILIRDGYAIEGATSNVFIVKDNLIKTPPLTQEILAGVTRNVIVQLLKQHQINYIEAPILEAELLTADEVWITSSSREILPIIKINDKPVGNGNAGAMWEKVIKIFTQASV